MSDTRITGVDVSAYQPRIDWAKVAAAGHRFAFTKATEGLTYTSLMLEAQWEGAQANGLLVGAYHFGRPRLDPIRQAEYFYNTVGPWCPGDLPPVLDFEVSGRTVGKDGKQIKPPLPPTSLVQWAIAFLEHAERLFGRTPILYTGPAFWRGRMGATDSLSRYPLWEAQYPAGVPKAHGVTPTPPPTPMPAWPAATIWQWTGKGQCAGIAGNVDLNLFLGDEAALRRLAGCETGGSCA